MHKLLNIYNYTDKKLFGDFKKATQNKIATYDVDFTLKLSCWKAFFKERTASSIFNLKFNDIKELKIILGLSTRTNISDISIKVNEYLAKSSIQIVKHLTSYRNPNDLIDKVGFCDLSLSGLILDTVRSINCHYKTRRIHGTESVLKGNNELTVNIDGTLNDSEKFNIDDIYYYLINYNKVISLLGLDKIVDLESINELYNSNDFDCSIDVVYNSNKNFTILTGDGHDDINLINGLLILPHYKSTQNFDMLTTKFVVQETECLSVLQSGKLIDYSVQDFNILEENIIESKVVSNYSQIANRSITTSRFKGDFNKTKKDNEEPKDLDKDNKGIVMPK